MLVKFEDFDWSLTERELVIFIPNWGRGNYVHKTLKAMTTKIPCDKWIIIIGNDCQHEDLSNLVDQNVVYFTFDAERDRPQERGGGFIRNMVIKRCRSKWFFQRDPEIVIENDFIDHILQCPTDMYRLSGPTKKVRKGTSERFLQGQATIEDCKQDADEYPINPQHFVYANFAFAVRTQILKDMRGFDEDYGQTYCYDRDLFVRLVNSGIKITSDPECKPIHIWHPTPSFPNTSKTISEYDAMKAMFASKDAKQIVRNPHGWGEGDKFISKDKKVKI